MLGLEKFFESVFCTQNHTSTSTEFLLSPLRLFKIEEEDLIKIRDSD